jgi:DNA-directed RNA polymerase subunit RPC12/RpoP
MKTFICKKCKARFTGIDVIDKNGGEKFECPKCGARDAIVYQDKGIKKKSWKSIGSFLNDNLE